MTTVIHIFVVASTKDMTSYMIPRLFSEILDSFCINIPFSSLPIFAAQYWKVSEENRIAQNGIT